jgi:hypothetical protein
MKSAASNTGTANRRERLDQDQVLLRAGSNPAAIHWRYRKAFCGSTSKLEKL